MIEINGSIGYGQVLRTSIAISALTLKPVRIFNIRKGRSKPGLMPQHLTGVKIAGEFCNAEIKGLQLGSTEVEFIPKYFNVSDRKINIGTAGSIGLLLQTLAPLMVFADKSVTLEIIGGTAGLGSPTIQFIKHITFPILSKLGIPLPEIEIIREGFYPKGNGLVKIKFFPVKKLKPIQLIERGKIKSIAGVSIAGSLPLSVAERQANTARKILLDYVDNVDIHSYAADTLSPGTSITLWGECENTILGADNIGKKGVKAEIIGEQCARELITSVESKDTLDKYMADQILLFLALADGKSEVIVEKITEHVETNIRVIKQMLNTEIDVEDKKISVEGIGRDLSNSSNNLII